MVRCLLSRQVSADIKSQGRSVVLFPGTIVGYYISKVLQAHWVHQFWLFEVELETEELQAKAWVSGGVTDTDDPNVLTWNEIEYKPDDTITDLGERIHATELSVGPEGASPRGFNPAFGG
jgi:hypothetical protein